MSKENFIIQHHQLQKIRKLKQSEKAILFDLLSIWRLDKIEPKDDGSRVFMMFSFLKESIEFSDKQYETICNRNKINGLKGGRPPSNNNPENPVGYLGTQDNPIEPKITQKTRSDQIRLDQNRIENKKEKIDKKENIVVPLETRVTIFKESLFKFCKKRGGEYDEKMVQEFFDYWSEPNKSKTKMRFESQKTWEISRRLAVWHRNTTKWDKVDKSSVKMPNRLTYEELADRVAKKELSIDNYELDKSTKLWMLK